MTTFTNKTTCNICFDDKEDIQMVHRMPSSHCKCTLRMCIDCALQCDNYWICSNSKCPSVHSECPQCKFQVDWPGCVSDSVLTNAKRIGFLFKKAREQFGDADWARDHAQDAEAELHCTVEDLEEEIANLKRINAELMA